MIIHGVTRSAERPEEMLVDEKSVWVAGDIQEVTVADEDGGTHIEYEYNLIQYTKDEYIHIMIETNEALSEDLTNTQLALVEVYEMIGG